MKQATDARLIATLFECGRLQTQLIIAAPENISPEKGTPINGAFQYTEHHVMACVIRAATPLETLPGSVYAPPKRVSTKAAARRLSFSEPVSH